MVNATQWTRAQDVFFAALDLPGDQQANWIGQACVDEPELADLILSMLREDRAGQTLLDSDLFRLAEAALAFEIGGTEPWHEQVGPYRLLRLLGEGGSGVVYLAERRDIGGQVSIKFLRHAALSPKRRERFQQEQRTLVRLNHPGIARIYDANTLPDGTPWFAMEFVDGQPLSRWLASSGGDIREALLLFRQVCEAVRYAHSLAVVHRDLKPSNILVTADGQVKLLDFGIAKQLDTVGDPLQTVEGLRMMTPAYAAPEQRHGGDIGAFTDVYALGVILYEILAGALPQRHGAGAESLEEAPPPPSRIAGRSPRQKKTSSLLKREWADLDVMCLTAMAPEPDRRYLTVHALLSDLDAFHHGLPLRARPPSHRYAAAKFLRRHRSAVAALATAILAYVLGSTIFTVRLARARDAAVAEAARVNRIQRFTESLFDGGDHNAGRPVELKTSDLLRRGEIEAEGLSGDPRMQADLFHTLGTAYQRLGSFGQADMLLGRALQERKQHFGEGDAQFADSLYSLGSLRKDERRMGEAESLLHEAVARRRALGDMPGLRQALVGLGSVLSLDGQYRTARVLLEEGMSLAVPSHSQGTSLEADNLAALADVAFYQADYGRAENLNRQALAINRQLYGNQHPRTGENLSSLGEIEKNRGDLPGAEVLLTQAASIDTGWYGPSHPAVAADLTSVSHLLIIEKRFDEAEALLTRALSIELGSYGEVHSQVAAAWNEIGVLAYVRGEDNKAEAAFRKALAIYTATYGPKHQFVGLCYSNLSGVDMHRKNYAAGEANAVRALQIYGTSLPPEHINAAIAHLKLGRCLLHENRYAEARPEALRAVTYFTAHGAPDDAYLNAARHDLSEIDAHLQR